MWKILGVRIYDTVPEHCKPIDICCMGQGSFVIDCGALENVLCGTRAGAVLLLGFFFHFPVSQCTFCMARNFVRNLISSLSSKQFLTKFNF